MTASKETGTSIKHLSRILVLHRTLSKGTDQTEIWDLFWQPNWLGKEKNLGKPNVRSRSELFKAMESDNSPLSLPEDISWGKQIYAKAVIESQARSTVVPLKSKA